jgi:hypothetical protein
MKFYEAVFSPNFYPFRTHFPSSQLTYCKPLIFDMEKYGQPNIGGQFWTGEILTSTLSQLDIL